MTVLNQDSILGGFIARQSKGKRPIPLKSTAYSVEVLGGIALVSVTRVFRNDESSPIEATMTFPVPFDAVVTDLVTKVAGRTLVGKAASKAQARETYENAIDRGKGAVLHEELLRGLHMVSVANVAPGAEIEVATTFAMPFSHADGNWRLRIPVTVGQIYGQLPLPDSDAVLTGGPVEMAEFTVSASSGTVLVSGQSVGASGKTSVPLNRPIEIEIVGAAFGTLHGRAADGRAVKLTVGTASAGEGDLTADIMADTSGSMLEPISADLEAGLTKWDVTRASLISAGKRLLTSRDRVRLWTFSTQCREIGNVPGDRFEALVRECPFDNYGTELPGAVAKVTAHGRGKNVLLITDGKSGKRIDVQAAVATGARFTVVLIGEDALESNVGYLAAMTGGQMFIVHGGDADVAIMAAVASMRSVASPAVPFEGAPKSVDRVIGGTRIAAEWIEDADDAPGRDAAAARIAAYAAGIALAGMAEKDAASLAEAEGIVSHLTSIVLVDEAGESVEGIPSTRKIPLADPATSMLRSSGFMAKSMLASGAPAMASRSANAPSSSLRRSFAAPLVASSVASFSAMSTSFMDEEPPMRGNGIDEALERLGRRVGGPGIDMVPDRVRHPMNGFRNPGDGLRDYVDARTLAPLIEWDRDAGALSTGDLSGQAPHVQAVLARIASIDAVRDLATSLGKSALLVAIALTAKAGQSRAAGRIARSVLAGADADRLRAAENAIGL